MTHCLIALSRSSSTFTTRPCFWASAQPDSLTTTVAAQDADSGSLLNLYRRLIHLRKQNEALATGRLVPLTATSPHVAAYLRRTDRDVVLVIANERARTDQ